MIGRKTGAVTLVVGVAALAAIPVASGASGATAAKARKKTVLVQDNPTYQLKPGKLTVKRNTTITWKWDSSNFDSHDVKLKKGPKGFKKFHSEIASTGYTFKRKLTKKGKYTVICSLHPIDMRQTITVK